MTTILKDTSLNNLHIHLQRIVLFIIEYQQQQKVNLMSNRLVRNETKWIIKILLYNSIYKF